MGSYNRKQCAISGCETFIYDGDSMCEDHEDMIVEWADLSDMPCIARQWSEDVQYGNSIRLSNMDGTSVTITQSELERVLTELGWKVTPPGMHP